MAAIQSETDSQSISCKIKIIFAKLLFAFLILVTLKHDDANLIRVHLKPSAQARGDCVDRIVKWNQAQGNASAQGHAIEKMLQLKKIL